MSRQGQGLVTRSVSVGSTADVLKARNRAVPSGKRGNDENSKVGNSYAFEVISPYWQGAYQQDSPALTVQCSAIVQLVTFAAAGCAQERQVRLWGYH